MSKRYIILTITVLLLFSLLVGCSKDDNSDKKTTTVRFAIKTNVTTLSESNIVGTTKVLILYPITESITTQTTESTTYSPTTTRRSTSALPLTTKEITKSPSTAKEITLPPSTTVYVLKPATQNNTSATNNTSTTVKIQTEPNPQTTVSPQTVSDDEIVVLMSPGTVKKGQNATVEIKGEPNTLYSIKVKYSSGYSSAKGLEDKMSDENGVCSWTWRVGAKTKSGSYNITVSDGQMDYIITFSVE